ncbi:hypothetical protein BpHYR1_040992 [Brachionus plicatilis]|uniref:Uncharacterized protein n=1 Tax=Brachionus plicatilis TaxID=10195 RepID=A0A3M7QQU1_BRAPC|nr:hypothetical protein BpHYR1_040992 [Brachionus plicatilis]
MKDYKQTVLIAILYLLTIIILKNIGICGAERETLSLVLNSEGVVNFSNRKTGNKVKTEFHLRIQIIFLVDSKESYKILNRNWFLGEVCWNIFEEVFFWMVYQEKIETFIGILAITIIILAVIVWKKGGIPRKTSKHGRTESQRQT